jgi:PAS domain S-box-containing protein
MRTLRRENAALRKKVRALESSHFEADVYRARFSDLYNFAPVGYLTMDVRGRVTDLNLSAAAFLGRSRKMVLKMPFAVCVASHHLGEFLEHLRRCRESGERVSTELELRRADGTLLPVQLLTTRMPRGEDSATLHLTALIDLTGPKATERTLRHSEEWLRMALRCATAGIWDFELGTGRASWSPEFYQLLGLDPERVPPGEKALLAVLHPKDRRSAQKLVDAVFSGEREQFHAEYRINDANGEGRWLAMFGRLVLGAEGQTTRVTGIGIDITALKHTEELLRKARETLEQRVQERTSDLQAAKARLEEEVADRRRLERQMLEVSEREQRRIGRDLHDGLGQQITGILFHAHLLEKHLAARGIAEAKDAGKIVAFLDEAKVQARRIARGLQPVEPEANGLMAGLEHFAATASELYHVKCRFDCPKPVLVAEHLTATHLFRIAQEAVANAFRHGGASVIQIRLRRSGGIIELEIRDNGRGLPKRQSPQNGLGLRFMKFRAETVGGALEVRLNPRGGTVIHCTVPAGGPPPPGQHPSRKTP